MPTLRHLRSLMAGLLLLAVTACGVSGPPATEEQLI